MTEDRTKFIGASEFAACLGLDPYKTPLDLFYLKTGAVAPFGGNKHTQRGVKLEAMACAEFTAIDGRKLIRRNAAYEHPEHSFIVGHVDRVFVGEKRIAEVKAPSVAAFRKMQREGLPTSYIIQANGYLGLSGFKHLTFIIFCADLWEVASFDIEFDETIYNAAISAAVKLWNDHILQGIPPVPVPADKPNIEFMQVGGSNITFRDDEAFTNAAQLLREAIQLEKDASELKELAKTRILETIERQYGSYQGGGIRFHWSQKAGRKTFDKKALAAAHPEINLEPFEKQGNPYDEFRPYIIGE